MKDVENELLNDFKKSLETFNPKSYHPQDPAFVNSLLVGMMWNVIHELVEDNEDAEYTNVPAVANASIPTDEVDDVDDELASAKKYYEWWYKTKDPKYKDMAFDELRHAKILMTKRWQANPIEPEREKLKKQDEMHQSIYSKLQ